MFGLGCDDGHSLMPLVVHSYDLLLSLVVTEIHGLVVLTYDPLSLFLSSTTVQLALFLLFDSQPRFQGLLSSSPPFLAAGGREDQRS